MKKFGIIAAMQEEMQEIQKIMDDAKKTKIYDLNFIKGKIGNYEVVLVEAGVGKVNAARTTQILIDNFEIDAIINVGSAAAANEKLNIGDNKSAKTSNKWLVFKIEITTENNTTNPPINKIVLIEFEMLFPIIPPKLDSVRLSLDEVYLLELDMYEFFLYFQNLKTIPTVIDARRWVISKIKPIVELANILIPTVPTINKGPELLVKLKRRSHSSLEQILFVLKSAAIFAPIGYPLIIPIIKAKLPSPRILKTGFINLFKSFPR